MRHSFQLRQLPVLVILFLSLTVFFVPRGYSQDEGIPRIEGELFHIVFGYGFTVTYAQLDIRDKPSLEGKVVFQASQNQEFVVREEDVWQSCLLDTCWYKVELDSGKLGWIPDRINGNVVGYAELREIRRLQATHEEIEEILDLFPADMLAIAEYITMANGMITAFDGNDILIAIWNYADQYLGWENEDDLLGIWRRAICDLNGSPNAEIEAKVILYPGENSLPIYDQNGQQVENLQYEATKRFTVQGVSLDGMPLAGFQNDGGEYRFISVARLDINPADISQLPTFNFESQTVESSQLAPLYTSNLAVSELDLNENSIVIDGQIIPIKRVKDLDSHPLELGVQRVDTPMMFNSSQWGIAAIALGWMCEVFEYNGFDTPFVALVAVTQIDEQFITVKYVFPVFAGGIFVRSDNQYGETDLPHQSLIYQTNLINRGTMIYTQPQNLDDDQKDLFSQVLSTSTSNEIIIKNEGELLSILQSPDSEKVYIVMMGILVIPNE